MVRLDRLKDGLTRRVLLNVGGSICKQDPILANDLPELILTLNPTSNKPNKNYDITFE